MSGELKIADENINGIDLVRVSGEVDIYTSQKLKEKLYEVVDRSKGDLKLDFEHVNYIDSTGLGVLVGALKKASQNNRKIYILNLKDNIKKLFLITGLDKVFIIEE